LAREEKRDPIIENAAIVGESEQEKKRVREKNGRVSSTKSNNRKTRQDRG